MSKTMPPYPNSSCKCGFCLHGLLARPHCLACIKRKAVRGKGVPMMSLPVLQPRPGPINSAARGSSRTCESSLKPSLRLPMYGHEVKSSTYFCSVTNLSSSPSRTAQKTRTSNREFREAGSTAHKLPYVGSQLHSLNQTDTGGGKPDDTIFKPVIMREWFML